MLFLGIAGQDTEDDMAAFIERHGLEFPNVADPEGDIWLAFGVTSRSSFLFIDDDGTSELTGYGQASFEMLSQRAEALIAS